MAFSTRRLVPAFLCLALVAGVAAPRLTAARPDARTISLYNIHSKETLTIEYKKGGQHIPEAMEKIDWILRDWRKDEKTRMDPALIDLLWEIHTELGSREPIHVISGYRSRGTNDMLRKTVGGQASQSRHILGKAADVHFPDISVRQLRYSALVRERGGVGYYPTSAIPFVHVDVDRVRAWPRLPRYELALLFPNGRTQHQPAEGGPIGPEDVRVAQAQHQEVAQQVAEYLDIRKGLRRPMLVAETDGAVLPTPPKGEQRISALTPIEPAPQLIAEPRLIDRPSPLIRGPTEMDRARLGELAALAARPEPEAAAPRAAEPSPVERQLASLGPPTRGGMDTRFGWGTPGWVSAAEYDDEHPEELAYRPFPIAPYLTESSSPDDPALAILVHPDAIRTLELLDQAGTAPPMRLRPGRQVAQVIWAQEFRGEAVAISALFPEPPAAATGGLANRSVKTGGP